MQKISFNSMLLTAEGEEAILPNGKPTTLSKFLAAQISGWSAEGLDAIRFWDWAMNLAKDLPIHLAPVDITTLQTKIEKDERLTVLAKAQLLNKLALEAKATDTTPSCPEVSEGSNG